MITKIVAPGLAVPGGESNGGKAATVCVYSSESRWDDATLKTLLVDALLDIEADCRPLALAVGQELFADYPWLVEA